jgi:hypothetical protein
VSDEYEPQEQTDTQAIEPDFTSASEVAVWFGRETIRLIHSARREKALSRLRALSSAVDSWSKLHRLASESEALDELRRELDDLKAQIQQERRDGPQGVIRQ